MRNITHVCVRKLFLHLFALTSVISLSNSLSAQCVPPVLVLKTPAAVCSPNTINLTNQVDPSSTIPPGTTFTYLDNNGNAVSDPNAVSVSGTYTIVATAPGGCSDQENVSLTINQSP